MYRILCCNAIGPCLTTAVPVDSKLPTHRQLTMCPTAPQVLGTQFWGSATVIQGFACLLCRWSGYSRGRWGTDWGGGGGAIGSVLHGSYSCSPSVAKSQTVTQAAHPALIAGSNRTLAMSPRNSLFALFAQRCCLAAHVCKSLQCLHPTSLPE